MMLQKNSVFIFLGLLILACFSCSDQTIFSAYQPLENSAWKANEKKVFEFEIKDTISPKNMFIHIRNNSQYEFSNLYVITSLQFPNGKEVIDTLQYEMADATGRFLGQGFTEIKENKLFYKEQKVFPELGKYTFGIYQAMRKNGEVNPISSIKGIQDVGISIENY
jgi:gliding motility-associated lipoprotein GldH